MRTNGFGALQCAVDLVRQLGGPLALVGLLPALQIGGFVLPQMLVGGRLQAMPYKLLPA